MQAKEGFYALLEGCAELAGDLGRAKFSRARDLLELDARWQVRLGCEGGRVPGLRAALQLLTARRRLPPPFPAAPACLFAQLCASQPPLTPWLPHFALRRRWTATRSVRSCLRTGWRARSGRWVRGGGVGVRVEGLGAG